MRYSAHLIVATAAVIMLLLLSGCARTETEQQGAVQQQQEEISEAAQPVEMPDLGAAVNLSDDLDEALAELDLVG